MSPLPAWLVPHFRQLPHAPESDPDTEAEMRLDAAPSQPREQALPPDAQAVCEARASSFSCQRSVPRTRVVVSARSCAESASTSRERNSSSLCASVVAILRRISNAAERAGAIIRRACHRSAAHGHEGNPPPAFVSCPQAGLPPVPAMFRPAADITTVPALRATRPVHPAPPVRDPASSGISRCATSFLPTSMSPRAGPGLKAAPAVIYFHRGSSKIHAPIIPRQNRGIRSQSILLLRWSDSTGGKTLQRLHHQRRTHPRQQWKYIRRSLIRSNRHRALHQNLARIQSFIDAHRGRHLSPARHSPRPTGSAQRLDISAAARHADSGSRSAANPASIWG